LLISRKLFIGGLSYETTDESLGQYFEQFGQVASSSVLRESTTGRSRGFGFVTFAKIESAKAALSQARHIVDGRMVEAKFAVPRRKTEDGAEDGELAQLAANAMLFVGNGNNGIGSNNGVPPLTGAASSTPSSMTNPTPAMMNSGITGSAFVPVSQLSVGDLAPLNSAFYSMASAAAAAVANNNNSNSNTPTLSTQSLISNNPNQYLQQQQQPSSSPPFIPLQQQIQSGHISPSTMMMLMASNPTTTTNTNTNNNRGSPPIGDIIVNKIFVGGLRYATGHNELRAVFEQFGEVETAQVIFNRDTKKSRGFGFVVFKDPSAVDKVLIRQRTSPLVIDGKQIEVKSCVARQDIGILISNPSSPRLPPKTPILSMDKSPYMSSSISTNSLQQQQMTSYGMMTSSSTNNNNARPSSSLSATTSTPLRGINLNSSGSVISSSSMSLRENGRPSPWLTSPVAFDPELERYATQQQHQHQQHRSPSFDLQVPTNNISSGTSAATMSNGIEQQHYQYPSSQSSFFTTFNNNNNSNYNSGSISNSNNSNSGSSNNNSSSSNSNGIGQQQQQQHQLNNRGIRTTSPFESVFTPLSSDNLGNFTTTAAGNNNNNNTGTGTGTGGLTSSPTLIISPSTTFTAQQQRTFLPLPPVISLSSGATNAVNYNTSSSTTTTTATNGNSSSSLEGNNNHDVGLFDMNTFSSIAIPPRSPPKMSSLMQQQQANNVGTNNKNSSSFVGFTGMMGYNTHKPTTNNNNAAVKNNNNSGAVFDTSTTPVTGNAIW
jgi:RNA recognition motif-containing protein